MNESSFNELREVIWKRSLTPEEEAALRAYLAKQPEARALWEEEASVARSLRQMPDVPVASNFTAQVLRSINREGELARKPHGLSWPSRLGTFSWIRAAAGAVMVVGIGLFVIQQYRTHARAELARNLASFSQVASAGFSILPAYAVSNTTSSTNSSPGVLPNVEVFQDFDAIRRLSYLPDPDDTKLMAYLEEN